MPEQVVGGAYQAVVDRVADDLGRDQDPGGHPEVAADESEAAPEAVPDAPLFQLDHRPGQ